MKNIKRILVLGIALFLASCSTDDGSFDKMNNKKVGKIINDKVEITADRQDILSRFQNLALSHGVEVEYTHFEIRKLENNNYAMFAFSEDHLTKSAINLNLQGDELIVNPNSEGSITCKTNGCSSDHGCMPIQRSLSIDPSTLYWTCSECSSDCTKTTNVKIKKA